jgi:thiol-disulfide isomerase/thioredoxin
MHNKTIIICGIIGILSLTILSCASPTESTNPSVASQPTVILTTPATNQPIDISKTTPVTRQPTTGSKIGNSAPVFKSVDLRGNTISLADYRGKPVLLNFWATWCPPCRNEMPFLQQVYDEFKDKGLVWIEIDIQESQDEVNGFLAANNLSLPTIIDNTGGIANNYDIASIPTTFFIDSNGIIKQKIVGGFPNRDYLVQELQSILQ